MRARLWKIAPRMNSLARHAPTALAISWRKLSSTERSCRTAEHAGDALPHARRMRAFPVHLCAARAFEEAVIGLPAVRGHPIRHRVLVDDTQHTVAIEAAGQGLRIGGEVEA